MPPVNLVAYIFFYCRYKGRGFWYATIYQQQSSVRWNAIVVVAIKLGENGLPWASLRWRCGLATHPWHLQLALDVYWCSSRSSVDDILSGKPHGVSMGIIAATVWLVYQLSHRFASDIVTCPYYMIMILCIFMMYTSICIMYVDFIHWIKGDKTSVRIVNCHEVSKKMSTQTGASHGNCWESY